MSDTMSGLHPAAEPTMGDEQPLSRRQMAFCEHFIQTNNAAEAARRCGYSAGNAAATGSRLMKDPRILDRIEHLKAAGRTESDRRRDEMLEKLEHVYETAIEAGNLGAAVRAVEAQARLRGFAYGRTGKSGKTGGKDNPEPAGAAPSPLPLPRQPPVRFDRNGRLIRDFEHYLEADLDGEAEIERDLVRAELTGSPARAPESGHKDLPGGDYWDNL